jgi:hypothetical protein
MDDKKEAVMSKVGGAKDTVTGVVPDRRALKRAATHMRETAASNPLDLPLVPRPRFPRWHSLAEDARREPTNGRDVRPPGRGW